MPETIVFFKSIWIKKMHLCTVQANSYKTMLCSRIVMKLCLETAHQSLAGNWPILLLHTLEYTRFCYAQSRDWTITIEVIDWWSTVVGIHIIVYPEFSYVFQYTNTGIIISIQKWYSFININVKSASGVLFCSQATGMFSSESTEPILTKLCWDDPWVVPFQNWIRHFRPPTEMAATAELNLT
jgi:hypothetical protein